MSALTKNQIRFRQCATSITATRDIYLWPNKKTLAV